MQSFRILFILTVAFVAPRAFAIVPRVECLVKQESQPDRQPIPQQDAQTFDQDQVMNSYWQFVARTRSRIESKEVALPYPPQEEPPPYISEGEHFYFSAVESHSPLHAFPLKFKEFQNSDWVGTSEWNGKTYSLDPSLIAVETKQGGDFQFGDPVHFPYLEGTSQLGKGQFITYLSDGTATVFVRCGRGSNTIKRFWINAIGPSNHSETQLRQEDLDTLSSKKSRFLRFMRKITQKESPCS